MARTKKRAVLKNKAKSPPKSVEEHSQRQDVENERQVVEEASGSETVVAVTNDTEPQGGFDLSQAPRNRDANTEPGEAEYGGWWSAKKEDELIDLYRDAKHMWDKGAPGYKTRNKKEIAVKAWSVKLAIPGE